MCVCWKTPRKFSCSQRGIKTKAQCLETLVWLLETLTLAFGADRPVCSRPPKDVTQRDATNAQCRPIEDVDEIR